MESQHAIELQKQLGLCSEFYSRNFYYSNGEGRLIPFKEDRNVLRGVIMGEAGGEGFVGACILAQTMRDNWLYAGYSSASEVQYGCQYDGWSDSTNDDVEKVIKSVYFRYFDSFEIHF